MYIVRLTINSTVESAIWGVTSTGNANNTRPRLVQFHTLPVPVALAINPHIALSTVLFTIHINCTSSLARAGVAWNEIFPLVHALAAVVSLTTSEYLC